MDIEGHEALALEGMSRLMLTTHLAANRNSAALSDRTRAALAKLGLVEHACAFGRRFYFCFA